MSKAVKITGKVTSLEEGFAVATGRMGRTVIIPVLLFAKSMAKVKFKSIGYTDTVKMLAVEHDGIYVATKIVEIKEATRRDRQIGSLKRLVSKEHPGRPRRYYMHE